MADRPAAVLALFDSPEALLEAVPTVKERALGRLEAYTPYPVHGLSEALGLKPSPLGIMVMVAGLLGAAAALVFQWWTSAAAYPVVVGGKALFSWQAFVPIIFEVTVLFATFTAGLGMLFLLNKLPFFGHPILTSSAVKAFTRDKFALAVEAVGGSLDVPAAQAALEGAGGSDVEVVFETKWKSRPMVAPLRELLAIALACVVAGLLTYQAVKWFPLLPPMNHLSYQNKVKAFGEEAFFKDGRAMRDPVPGTVARGSLPAPGSAGSGLVNPLPPTEAVLDRGREGYEVHCRVCHGPLGNGEPSLSPAYKAVPANLQGATFLGYTDGHIFSVITEGHNTMPAYGADISPDERWAIVHYVRVLQRSQHAREEDLR